jgi:hypothetical protein
MPINEQSSRTIRYENRCTKKNIENQNKERDERYERRSAMKTEARESVASEMKTHITQYSSSYDLRRLQELKQPLRYGVFGFQF